MFHRAQFLLFLKTPIAMKKYESKTQSYPLKINNSCVLNAARITQEYFCYLEGFLNLYISEKQI